MGIVRTTSNMQHSKLAYHTHMHKRTKESNNKTQQPHTTPQQPSATQIQKQCGGQMAKINSTTNKTVARRKNTKRSCNNQQPTTNSCHSASHKRSSQFLARPQPGKGSRCQARGLVPDRLRLYASDGGPGSVLLTNLSEVSVNQGQ